MLNNRKFWAVVATVVLILFLIALITPPSNYPSQRNGTYSQPDNVLYSLFVAFIATLLVIWMFWSFTRRRKSATNDIMSIGKNRYHKLMPGESNLTFQDVGGAENAKSQLKEMAQLIKSSQPSAVLGIRPSGILLTGAPGTGKTLLAKALCKEVGLPLLYTSGSEFNEMFIGIGASRIRDLFEAAKRQAPAIVFVDALDAIGRRREAQLATTQGEYEQVLQQFMIEMDNLKANTRILVIAATNRDDLLDPALTRSGRLERRIHLGALNAEEREAILKIHTRGKPLAADVDWKRLAESSAGFVGADLERLVNEAALMAAKNRKPIMSMTELESAVQLVKAL